MKNFLEGISSNFGQTATELQKSFNIYHLNETLNFGDTDYIKLANFVKDYKLTSAVYSGVLALFVRLKLKADFVFPVTEEFLATHKLLKAASSYMRYSDFFAVATMISNGLLDSEETDAYELLRIDIPMTITEYDKAKEIEESGKYLKNKEEMTKYAIQKYTWTYKKKEEDFKPRDWKAIEDMVDHLEEIGGEMTFRIVQPSALAESMFRLMGI